MSVQKQVQHWVYFGLLYISMCLCVCVCVSTCDSAVKTGEGDVEKCLAGVQLLLPQRPRTGGGGGGGEVKRHIMRCLRPCVQETQLVSNLDHFLMGMS